MYRKGTGNPAPQIVDKVVSAYKRWSHFVLPFQIIQQEIQYGDQILPVIRRYAPEPDTQKVKKPAKQAAGSTHAAKAGGFQACKDRIIARGSVEAYQPWTKKEDEQLIHEQKEGKTTKEMSEIHKRTPGAIKSRLKKLELT